MNKEELAMTTEEMKAWLETIYAEKERLIVEKEYELASIFRDKEHEIKHELALRGNEPKENKRIVKLLEEVQAEKEKLISKKEFAIATVLHDKEQRLLNKLNTLKNISERISKGRSEGDETAILEATELGGQSISQELTPLNEKVKLTLFIRHLVSKYARFAMKEFHNKGLYYFKIYSDTFSQDEILLQLENSFSKEDYLFEPSGCEPPFIDDNEDMLEMFVTIIEETK